MHACQGRFTFSNSIICVYVVMILTIIIKKKQKDPHMMGLTVMYADKGTLKGTAIILMNFFSMLSGLKKEDLF